MARKTRRLVEQLQQAEWKPSPHSDAAAECEFLYQPQGWGRACRFVALRYEKEPETEEVEQYQLFATSAYTYRVFVTNLAEPIALDLPTTMRAGPSFAPLSEGMAVSMKLRTKFGGISASAVWTGRKELRAGGGLLRPCTKLGTP